MSSQKILRTAKSSPAVNARHEAAHAVVSVRLGLPLASTDIRTRRVERRDETFEASGYTTLVEGTVAGWQARLPDPSATAAFVKLGTQVAAGIMADEKSGMQIGDVGHRDDSYQLVQIACLLGHGTSNHDPAVRQFMAERCVEAREMLEFDDGAAWDRVRFALERKRCLTGAEVCALIAAVPDQMGKR